MAFEFLTGKINPWLIYLTLGLLLILVILSVLLHLKKKRHQSAKSKFLRALQRRGIQVIDHGPFKTGKEEDVDGILNQLDGLLEAEKQVKEEEKILTRKIEELYRRTRPLVGDIEYTPDETEKTNSEEIDADIKSVLLKVDDLLEHLPQDVIDEFVGSPDFESYKKVVQKAKENRQKEDPKEEASTEEAE
jgi:hypothetical protein